MLSFFFPRYSRAKSYQQNSLKNSSEFWPNSQISENSSDFFLNVLLSKFLGKNAQNFAQLTAPKLSDFLSENWPYQHTVRKVFRIWILQLSLKNLKNFSAASWTKFRGFFIGYFGISTFQKSENSAQILIIFFREF